MKRVTAALAMLTVVGCKPALSPQVWQHYQNRTLYTCCNIHYEGDQINDANYFVGATVPFGSPVQVQSIGRNSITFLAGGTKLTLEHLYGKDQESFEQYADKVLVSEDPKLRVASVPRMVQDAIRDGRVERGMTREQVILSLGYPPSHRTPSLSASEWTYWHNRWLTYKVAFDDAGVVSNVIGRPAPTRDEAIKGDEPPPAVVPKKRHR
jgi:hypothetical protein